MSSFEIVAIRLARLLGLHSEEVYPVVRLRDRRLIALYSRELGWLWTLRT